MTEIGCRIVPTTCTYGGAYIKTGEKIPHICPNTPEVLQRAGASQVVEQACVLEIDKCATCIAVFVDRIDSCLYSGVLRWSDWEWVRNTTYA